MTLTMDYDFDKATATIATREFSLRDTNVVMVDFVDSVGGPTIVDTAASVTFPPAPPRKEHRMRALIVVVLLAGLSAMELVQAQSQTTGPAFEVVSIKPRTGARAFGGSTPPNRFSRPDTTVRPLLLYAYD